MTWIAELAPILTAMGFLLNAIVSACAYWQSRQNAKRIEVVHLATNSLTDKLVKVTGEAEYAKGVKQGEDSSANVEPR
jgi:hypothetical protein